MNMRTRLALMLLISVVPNKEVSSARMERIVHRLGNILAQLREVPMGGGRVSIRELLTAILEGVE